MTLRGAPAFLAAAILATGCGGGDDGPGREDFITRADDVCRGVDRAIAELKPPTTPKELAAQVERLVGVSDDALRRFRALDAPEDLRGQVRDYIGALERQTAVARQTQAAASEANRPDLERLAAQTAELNARSDRIAADIGFRVCGAGRG